MAEDKLVQIFASLDILQEINRVLEYERILRILKRSRMKPSSIMTTIVSLSSLVDVKVNALEEDLQTITYSPARRKQARNS